MSKISKLFAASAVAVAMSGGMISAPALAAGIPTFDEAAAANFLNQMMEMKKQLDTAKDQLKEAEKMFDTVSGNRGFGNSMRNPDLANYLPDDWKSVYSATQGGNYRDITGSVTDIMGSEKISGDTNTARTQSREREARLAATNKAMGMQAFEGAKQRLNQIEGLMNQIGATQDPKAIAELQARIAGEQASIQNEMTKLQMMARLQEAEKDLIIQQKREIMRQDFSASNTGMPGIK